jgi:hypothetical protein
MRLHEFRGCSKRQTYAHMLVASGEVHTIRVYEVMVERICPYSPLSAPSITLIVRLNQKGLLRTENVG